MASMSAIIISLMVFSGVMVAFGQFYGDTVESYHAYNTSFNSTTEMNFTQFNQSSTRISDYMNDIEKKLLFSNKSVTDPTKYTDAVMAFIPVGGIILEVPNIITEYVNLATKMIGIRIPAWFISLALVSTVVVIVMRVASYFLKREQM